MPGDKRLKKALDDTVRELTEELRNTVGTDPVSVRRRILLQSAIDQNKNVAEQLIKHQDRGSNQVEWDKRKQKVERANTETRFKLVNLRRERLDLMNLKETVERRRQIAELEKRIKTLQNNREITEQMMKSKPLKVEMTFTFRIKDMKTKQIVEKKITDSRITRDDRFDIDKTKAAIREKLTTRLLAYQQAIHEGGVVEQMYRIIKGDTKEPFTLELNKNSSNLWIKEATKFTNVNYVGERDIVVNSFNSPVIVGLESFVDPVYGCVVGLLHSLDKRVTQKEIAERLRNMAGEPNLLEKGFDQKLGAREEDFDLDTYEVIPEVIGYTIGQVEEYFKLYLKGYQYYFHFPLRKTIEGKRPESHHIGACHMTVVNNHLYKNKFESRLVWEDDLMTEFWSADMDFSEVRAYVDALIEQPVKIVVYCDVGAQWEFIDILSYIMKKHNISPDVEPAEYGICKFRVGDMYFLTCSDYEDRKALYEKIKAKYPKHANFVGAFKNQSYASMSRSLFEIEVGVVPKSINSCYDHMMYRKYKTKPFTGMLGKQTLADKYTQHIDISKCYLQWIVENRRERIGVYDSLCNFEFIPEESRSIACSEFNSASFVAEVILDSFTIRGILNIPAMVWPSSIVGMMLMWGWIDSSKILYIRKPRSWYSVGKIADWVEQLLVDYGGHSKHLYTTLFGSFGVCESNTWKGFLSTDREYVAGCEYMGMKSREVSPGVHCLYKKTNEQKIENDTALFRFIVCGSIVKLGKLVSWLKRVDPEVNFLSSRVDNIYFESKVIDDMNDQVSEFINRPWGKARLPYAKFEEVKRNCILKTAVGVEEIEDVFTEGSGYALDASAGNGKTVAMIQDMEGLEAKIHALGTCTANLVKDELRKGLKKNEKITWRAKNSAELKVIHERGKLFMKKYDVVYIDEASMLGVADWDIINLLRAKWPSVKIVAAGDVKQLGKPAKEVQIKFSSNPAIKFLIGEVRKMDYEFWNMETKTGRRLTKELYEISERIGDINNDEVRFPVELESCVVAKIPDGVVYDESIASTNKKCEEIDELMKERGWKGKFDYLCNTKGKGYVNGTPVTKEDVAKMKIPADHLIPYSCKTVWKAQGSTIEGKVLINELMKMSREGFYTAITRIHDKSQLTIVGDLEKLRSHVWKPEPTVWESLLDWSDLDLRVDDMGEYINWKTREHMQKLEDYKRFKLFPERTIGKATCFVVYLITDKVGKYYYVGITESNSDSPTDKKFAIEKRLGEHFRDKPELDRSAITEEICYMYVDRHHVNLEALEADWIHVYQRRCRDGWRMLNSQNLEKVREEKEELLEGNRLEELEDPLKCVNEVLQACDLALMRIVNGKLYLIANIAGCKRLDVDRKYSGEESVKKARESVIKFLKDNCLKNIKVVNGLEKLMLL